MIGQILLLPFMGQGHFNAFVNFAKIIHRHHPSCTITMVSTSQNITKLRSMLPSSPQVHFAVLPFDPTAHGLPPDGECTDVLPPHLINQLVDVSTHSLRPGLEQVLSNLTSSADGSRRICLIADVFCSWAVDVAEKLGVFHVVLSTCGAFGIATTFTIWLHLPHLNSSSEEFEFPCWPGMRLHRSQLNDNLKAATGTDMRTIAYKSFTRWSLRSSGMLVNSMEEIEAKGLQRLRVMYGNKPVWSIGPLISDSILADTNQKSSMVDVKQRLGKKPGVSDEDCTKWLDQHPPCSVIYISFGSQITISSSQMRELASGLEESGKSFIWVVRPPSEFELEDEFRASEWLPAGFEERMRERNQGLVVRNWAPQLVILSHESTGAFLSHCGWNSVLESLGNGVPIIGWPQAAEQFYNAKMMVEEMGVCIELARGNKANIKSEEVAKVANLVIGSESAKGKELRSNANKLREMMMRAVRVRKKDSSGTDGDDDSLGSSIAALNSFMETAFMPQL